MPDKSQILSLIHSGQWPQAKTLCMQLCQDKADDSEAWLMLAGINAHIGAMDEVITCCRKVVELQPDNVAAYYNLGVALQFKGRHEEAVTVYLNVVERDPHHAQTHANLGLAWRELGKMEEAIASCNEALRLQPALIEAHNTLGLLLKDQGNFEAAAISFKRATAYRPKYAEAHYNLGLCREAQGNQEETVMHYRRAVEAKPDFTEAWNKLGNTLLERGGVQENYAEAQNCFQKVLQFYPENIVVWFNLGVACQQQKKMSEALECFLKVKQLNTDHEGAHLRLASIYREKGLFTDAEKMYREAMRINPDNSRLVRYYLAVMGAEESPHQHPEEYVAGLFDSCADDFEYILVAKLNYHVPELISKILMDIVGGDAPKMDILDLGCGTGLCGPLFRGVAQRLTGIDLSRKMLNCARKKNVYDELIQLDVTEYLSNKESAYDLIIATDVFVYIGDLTNVFAACNAALKPGGLFAFSIETADKGSYVLRTTGRYAQTLEYVRGLAAKTGMAEIRNEEIIVRYEKNEPVNGNIIILKKTIPESAGKTQ